ncbi:MAG: DUF928 domain-containing protein [Nostocaceae cyanobacterium]|nr:DUF928 domain-containing protein [Nostocaceae cyanobacterium]
MNRFTQTIKLAFTLTFTLTTIIAYPHLVSAENNNQDNSQLPPPPDTGTPVGNSTPGGTRPQENCPSTKLPLRALIANNGKDFTVAKFPTFLFYIPYNPSDIKYIEFALTNPQELKTIYRTAIKYKQPGIIKISIPQDEKYALALNKDNRWHLTVYCNANQSDEPDKVLTGWVRRIPIESTLANQLKTQASKKYKVYLNNQVYYDGIHHLAEAYFANTHNRELSNAWNKLSASFNWIIDKKIFVNAELLPPAD